MNIKAKKIKKVLLIIVSVLAIFIIIAGGRLIYLSMPTKGAPIIKGNSKTALLVIDLQEDTINIPQYSKTKELIDNVNQATKYSSENGIEVIYIRQEYSSPFDLLLSGGRYKAGNKGSELSNLLHLNSDHIFTKLKSDTFSVKSFEQYLIDKQISSLYIVGADATACIYKTALGGVNRGYEVTILEDCIFSTSEKTLHKMLKKYEKDGINTAKLGDLINNKTATD